MPRYFFELIDGDEALHDADGQMFDDAAAARAALIGVLCDLAHETLPDGEHHIFRCELRDELARTLYAGTFTFQGGWVADPT